MAKQILAGMIITMMTLSCGDSDSGDSGVKNDNESYSGNAESQSASPTQTTGDIALEDIGSVLSELEADVLSLTNKHRASLGLKALTANVILQEQAKTHSTNMANGKVPFGHQGFDERGAQIRKSIKISGAAENVAYRQNSAAAVMASWLGSSGHRQNIEGNYRLMGISAVQNSQGSYYYTQIFAK